MEQKWSSPENWAVPKWCQWWGLLNHSQIQNSLNSLPCQMDRETDRQTDACTLTPAHPSSPHSIKLLVSQLQTWRHWTSVSVLPKATMSGKSLFSTFLFGSCLGLDDVACWEPWSQSLCWRNILRNFPIRLSESTSIYLLVIFVWSIFLVFPYKR